MEKQNVLKFARGMLLATVLLMAVHTPGLAAPTELSLAECVKLALENNPKMGIAQATNQQFAWDVEQAKSKQGIRLYYDHLSMRTTSPPSFWPSLAAVPAWNYSSNSLNLTVPVYSGGKLEGMVDAAKQGAKIADLQVAATRQQLKLETELAYFGALHAHNLLMIAQQAVDDFAGHLANVQRRYEAGTVAFSDVLQTKVKLANAENGFIKAQNSYDLAIYSLNTVIGLPLRNETRPKAVLEYQLDSRRLEDCISFALAGRPEMQQAQTAVQLAEEEIGIARSGNRPSVGFSANSGWAELNFPGADNRNWTVALTAEIDLFDSGNTKSRIEKAKAGVSAAKDRLRQANDTISLEVCQAFQNMREAEKRIEASKVAVEHAALDFSLAQKRYNAGVGINLDVMDAELALAQANTNYSQALYDYNTGQTELNKAMGMQP